MALTLTAPESPASATALRWPLGAASPLWFAFAGAAAVGASYYWLTRWIKPVNLESITPLPTDTVIAAAEPAGTSLLEAVTEVASESVVEAVVEAEATAFQASSEMAETVVAAADDLTALVGIGPKLAAALAEHGVVRFDQIAHWGESELDAFDRLLSLKGRAVRDSWVAQAKRLAESVRG